MKLKLALGLCLVAGTAAAQPTDQPPPPPDPTPEPTPEPPPAPRPPPPAPTGFVETANPEPPMMAPVDDNRPFGFSIGLGFGYELPNSLETPNITSARLRLGSGLTFEPIVRFQQTSLTTDVGASSTDKETTLKIGALARYPLKSRGRVDLDLLGGAFVQNVSTAPDASDADLSVTSFDAVYGVAVEFWVSQHWQISLNALNTIFHTQKSSQQMGPGAETVVTTTTFAAIFDPVISAMVHLYY